jgi:hypothetical protein
MSRTVEISDELYARLEAEAKRRGLESIERLLEEEVNGSREAVSKEEAVRQILEIQAKMSAKYGLMPDSAELIREDRAR